MAHSSIEYSSIDGSYILIDRVSDTVTIYLLDNARPEPKVNILTFVQKYPILVAEMLRAGALVVSLHW